MFRHPLNRNLTLVDSQEWQGAPLLGHCGPYIKEYLIRSEEAISDAVRYHNRIMAVRCDLRLPTDAVDPDSRRITKFLSSLKAKLAADQRRKAREGKRSYRTGLRYIWVKEQSNSSNPHYHCCLLLNGNAYHHLGDFTRGSNTAARIVQAWASALGISLSECAGLVHFPRNPVYYLNGNAPSYAEAYGNLLARVSYFAKAATKPFGDGSHHFGCSRSSQRM